MLRQLFVMCIVYSVANGAVASPEVETALSMVAAQIERLNNLETLGRAAAMTGTGARFDECANGILRDIRGVRTNRVEQQRLLAQISAMSGERSATVVTRLLVTMIPSDIKLIENMSGIVIKRAALCSSKQLDETAAMASVTFKQIIGQLQDMGSALSESLPHE